MTSQLEVIKFRDTIPVTGLPNFVPNLGVPTIELTGEDFSSVEQVLINEIVVSEFIVLNKTTLWAQMPESTLNRVDTVEVISSNFTRTAAGSKIEFRIGDNTKKISGILKLTQLFTKWILQSPGSSIFSPRRGGGLQKVVGSNLMSTKRADNMLSTLTRSVDNTSSQIRAAQVNYPGLPRDERLLSANLIDLNVYGDRMMAVARVRVISVAQDEATAGLVL